ncbi:type II secretion system F family protein, partial [bacterium]|nr:type II secretion system F family protein [bacterium]
SQDLRLAMNATIFQQETGGNLEDLYKQIVVMVSERKKIMGKVRAGTAHARLSGIMVGVIPWIFFLVMILTNRSYLTPMLESPLGWLMGVGALVSSVIGLIFIYRMTTGILPDADESMVTSKDPRLGRRWQLFRPILQTAASFNSRFQGAIFENMRQDLRYRLTLAGNPAGFTPDEFIGVKEFYGFVLMSLSVLFTNIVNYSWTTPILLIGIFVLGFQVPSIYLAQRIRARQMNIEYELPYMIDLLSLAIEAGLDLVGGIQKIVEKSRKTDVVMEFQLFLADIKVGKPPEEAMSEMAERVQILSFFSFVSSLIQAQRLGAEIGPTLRAQAEQMRYQRMIIAEEQMNQLPVKLLIPLVFFIFPSIFILVLGPTVIHFMKVFWNSGGAERLQ